MDVDYKENGDEWSGDEKMSNAMIRRGRRC